MLQVNVARLITQSKQSQKRCKVICQWLSISFFDVRYLVSSVVMGTITNSTQHMGWRVSQGVEKASGAAERASEGAGRDPKKAGRIMRKLERPGN